MASLSLLQCLSSLFLISFLSSQFSSAATNPPSPAIRAANLGGWLVTEGWMTPWLFDNITNNDLLDGTQVQLKSVAQNKYLTAENGGGAAVVANRSTASGWETFKLWRVSSTTFHFKVFNNQFIGLDSQGQGSVVATATSPETEETFEIVRDSGDANRIRLRAPNRLFLQANADGSVRANAQESTTWGDDDSSVFNMTIVRTMRGEFQITNGYGKDMATQVMTKHWNSYIVEDDFKFMSQNGINAVRIPVGYWIANDNNPPAPFVGGSLAALDNAFTWAENHGIKVIVTLHAPPGSPNGEDHSAPRDGSLEWGKTQESIDQSVTVIDFLASRYAKRSSFLAMELINEPHAPEVTLDSLERYYKAGYDTVRKYSSDCYVIMSTRLGNLNTTELLPFAGGLDGTVIDIHYYNLYTDDFKNMNAQQNIDYVNNQLAYHLSTLTRSNNPLVFIGEWTAEWEVKGATKEEYQSFAAAELKVFGQATFGWAYWSLKNVNDHWSLEWMINNGYISLQNYLFSPSNYSLNQIFSPIIIVLTLFLSLCWARSYSMAPKNFSALRSKKTL